MARNLKVEASIVADTASYTAGIKRAIGATDKFGRATKKAGNQNAFRNLGRSALGAAAGVVSLYGAYSQGKKAVTATKDLSKSTLALQRITNLSTRDASRFVAITKVRGIETNKLAVSFTALSKQIVQAQKGSKNAADAFKQLGVSQTAIKKGDTKQVFLDAADGLSKMGAGANRTALAAQLFGKSYKDLLPLLLSGSKGIQEQLGLAGRLGAEIGGSGADAFKKLAEAERTAKLAQLGLQIQLGQVLIPTLTKGVAVLSGFLIAVRQASVGTKAFGASLALVGGALLAGVSASIVAVVAGLAGVGGAFYLAYQKSAGFRAAINEIGAAAGPMFKSVAAVAKSELPKVARAAAQMATSIGQVITALKPIIVPTMKVIAAVIKSTLRSIAPQVKFASDRLSAFAGSIRGLVGVARSTASGVSSAFGAIKGAVSRVLSAVRGTIGAFRSVGHDIVSGLASGIRGAVGTAIQAAKDLANALPAWARKVLRIGSPSKVFEEIGKNVVDGFVVGIARNKGKTTAAIKAMFDASSFGAGTELGVYLAERALAGARGNRERRTARRRLGSANRAQTRSDNLGSIQEFFAGIVDRIKQAKLAQIMAPVNAARDKRAGAEYAATKASLSTQITRAQAEANNPKVQERYARERERLEKRIAAAREAGNLEAADSLQAEQDALDARYGPQYLTSLQDQLAQVNENEIERTSEAAAQAFADTFTKGMDDALKALLAGGTVQAFFDKLGQTLRGSGVSPGSLGDISGGIPAAAGGVQGSSLPGLIRNWFRGKRKGEYNASTIASAIGSSKAAVYRGREAAPRGYKIKNRANGGMLSPGALTMVGETGPELIVGGKVMSGTRTARMGGAGGMNITINAVGAAANDPVLLARELGWQLATR